MERVEGFRKKKKGGEVIEGTSPVPWRDEKGRTTSEKGIKGGWKGKGGQCGTLISES